MNIYLEQKYFTKFFLKTIIEAEQGQTKYHLMFKIFMFETTIDDVHRSDLQYEPLTPMHSLKIIANYSFYTKGDSIESLNSLKAPKEFSCLISQASCIEFPKSIRRTIQLQPLSLY